MCMQMNGDIGVARGLYRPDLVIELLLRQALKLRFQRDLVPQEYCDVRTIIWSLRWPQLPLHAVQQIFKSK